MAATSGLKAQEFLELARDKSEAGRSALVTAIKDIYAGERQGLTKQDRAMMVDIMGQLIREVESSVRRSLAEHFAEQPNAPRDLVLALANDEIEVAHPILAKSEVLKDAELIDIIHGRTMEHQLAIAIRPLVSERVTDALVETGNENVVSMVLSNRGAHVSQRIMSGLVLSSWQIQAYQKPLINRRDLSPALVEKLYRGVSTALCQEICENYDIDPANLDVAVDGAIANVIAAQIEASRQAASLSELEPDHEPGAEEEHPLVALLNQGQIAAFLDKFAAMSGLPVQVSRQILFEPGGQALGVTCKAMELDKHAFVTIFLRFRQGRLGDRQVETDELARALLFYDQTTESGAKALVNRWRKNPNYKESLAKIAQALGAAPDSETGS